MATSTIDIIYLIILLLATCVAFKKLFADKDLRIVPILMAITWVFYVIASIPSLSGKNNMYLYHFVTPIEYTCLSILYYRNIINKKVKRWILISIPFVIIICVYLSLYIQPLSTNNSYEIIICNTLIIICSLCYLYQILLDRTDKRLQYYPLCWISIGLLFYSMANLATQGPMNYLMDVDQEFALSFYHLGYIFSILYFMSVILASLFVSEKR